ncbi:MAG: hypothetical protein JW759_04590 [Candidatus Coatesbacteria bacterium]|nr:hypothetical protein [Candidatus Coatesbacteria bacterium]
MSTLIYLACTICLACASALWLTGYWLALDVPRPQIVSVYLPLILAHAALLLPVLARMGLRKKIDSGAKAVCAFGAIAFLLLASPLVTAESRYPEALSGFVLLGAIIAVSAVMILILVNNAAELDEKRLKLALLTICASCYFWCGLWTYNQHPPDGDEPYYLLTAHSIGYDLDFDRTNNFENKDYLAYYPYELQPQFRSISIKGKHYEVPNYDVGFPLLIALPYRLFGYRGAVALINLLAGLLVLNVFLLCQELGASRKHALLGALLFGFSVPMLNYANQVFPETPIALITIYAFRRLLRVRQRGQRELLVLLPLSLALFLLKIRLSLVIAPLLLLALWQTTRRKITWLYASGGAALIAVFGFLLRDRILTLKLLTSRLDELFRMGIADFTPSNGVPGQMLDQQFGLLVLAPIYILAAAGAAALFRGNRRMLLKMLLVAGPYYLVVGSLPWWNASWCPPCRFLIVILPFLGALLGLGLERIATLRQAAAFSFAVLISGVVAFLHLLSPVFRYDQANGANRAFWLLHVNTYIDLSRFLPSFFRTDITTPVKVLLEVAFFAVLLLAMVKSGGQSAPKKDLFKTGRYVYAGGIGAALVVLLLAVGTVYDLRAEKATYQMEDEPLSIYDPPARAYIRDGRRLTPGYPLEREVNISPGEKLVIVEAMMRNPIWTTVPNMWLELDSDAEKIRVVDEPVEVELMQKYYRRVRLAGGHYLMRLGISIPDVDMKAINPDKVADIYVDRVQIFDSDGFEGFLYAAFGRVFDLLSMPQGLEFMGHAYIIQPRYKGLGDRLFRSYIKAELWPEAADLFSFQADSDPFDLVSCSPEQLLKLAQAELVKKRYHHALLLLRLMPADTPVSLEAGLAAAQAHLGLSEIDAALSLLPAGAKDRAVSRKADYFRALCLIQKGESRQAYSVLAGLVGETFSERFDALCHLLRLARSFGDSAEASRARKLLHESRTSDLTVGQMTKSGGRAVDGGWVLESNGFFEAPVDVLSDTLAIGMNVKANGTFETHVETGLVLDPATGRARYVFPNLKVTLGDHYTRYITVPYTDWTNTYVFFEDVEPGAYNLRIEYINDHTFQKDRQDRRFFLRRVRLQSAIMFFENDIHWAMQADGSTAVFATELSAQFPVESLAVNLGEFPAGASADLELAIDGARRCSLPLDQTAGSLVECDLTLAPGTYRAVLTLRLPAASADINQITASIKIIGFAY